MSEVDEVAAELLCLWVFPATWDVMSFFPPCATLKSELQRLQCAYVSPIREQKSVGSSK